jgi:hypothetical protein
MSYVFEVANMKNVLKHGKGPIAYVGVLALFGGIMLALGGCGLRARSAVAAQSSPKPTASGAKLTPSAVTASRNDSEATFAVDGLVETGWNAASWPSQWIQLEFPETSVSRVLLLTDQDPAGFTTHQFYGGPSPESLTLLGSIDGETKGNQWLDFRVTADKIRYLKVTTSKSPSWVAWMEIEVYR